MTTETVCWTKTLVDREQIKITWRGHWIPKYFMFI